MDLSSIGLPTVSGRTLEFSAPRGGPAVLILSNQKTAKQVRLLEQAIHADAETAELPVIQIAHLVGVPRVVRKLAERDIRRGAIAQRDALLAARSARGLAPANVDDLLNTVLDWQGTVTTALGFSDADELPLVAVLHDDGTALPVAPGANLAAAVSNAR